MASKRRVRVDRDGNFTLDGHPYWLCRGTSVVTEGQWVCWDEALPEVDLSALSEAERFQRTRPLWVENTYADARDRIDRAAERGHF